MVVVCYQVEQSDGATLAGRRGGYAAAMFISSDRSSYSKRWSALYRYSSFLRF